MADLTYGLSLSADYELLGGTVDGMDVEKLSRAELAEFMDAATEAQNRAVNLIMGELALPTLSRGALLDQAPDIGEWPKATELDRGRRRKTVGLDAVGFPVNKYGPMRAGWTRDYLKKATNFELIRTFQKIMDGHMEANWKEALRAIFQNAEWTWSHDMFPEDGSLKVKPLLNADGYVSPDWSSNSFDGTETHYLTGGTSGTLDEADLETIASTLRKHGYGIASASGGMGGRIEVWLNSLEVTDAKAHTNFVSANDPVVIDANKAYAGGISQDTYVGYNSAARVFIREVEYIPTDYVLGFATNSQPNAPDTVARVNGFAPLRRRVPAMASLRGIQRVNESKYPLQESFWEDWFGFGVGARNTAVVMHLTEGAYAVPTIS